MYAFSVKPKYASLIVAGTKRIENHTWQTHYRGPLLIHAAQPVGAFIRQDKLGSGVVNRNRLGFGVVSTARA